MHIKGYFIAKNSFVADVTFKDGIIKETLLADDNKYLSSTAKDAAFCRTLKQKEETLAVLTTAQEKLEGE